MFASSRRIDCYAAWHIGRDVTYYVTLTRGQILALTFQDKTIYFSKRIHDRNTIVPLPILYFYWFKSYSWKIARNSYFDNIRPRYGGLTVDLRSMLRGSYGKKSSKASGWYSLRSSSYHSSWHNGTFTEKYNTICLTDLWSLVTLKFSERKNGWTICKRTY